MNKFCRVFSLIELLVSHWLIVPLRRGEAFEALIAPKNFTPLFHPDFLHCVAGLRSKCDVRLGC